MGNSLRCCLACVLPCGALDVIRVVHLNGHVEEFSHPVSAAEILAANPNHIISMPCSLEGDFMHRIVLVSPGSELKRGQIYFLIPSSPSSSSSISEKKKKQKQHQQQEGGQMRIGMQDQDGCLKEMLLEEKKKKHSHRRRTSGRVAVWHPHLESISEDP